jgi:HSP20 family protein
MPIIPWKPFWDIERWFEEFWPEELEFEKFPLRVPRMDMYEKDGKIIAEVELPGMNVDDIDVEVEDNHLKIEAKKEEKEEEKEKGYYRKEIKRGYFKRVIPLPDKVKPEDIEATYEGGILKIVLPVEKTEKKKGVKIKVKGEKSK